VPRIQAKNCDVVVDVAEVPYAVYTEPRVTSQAVCPVHVRPSQAMLFE